MHLGGWGLSFSMVISIGLVIAGIVLWYVFPMFGREWPIKWTEETAATPETKTTTPAMA
jgi:hypothetical protein